eukprot:CAMPEP_0195616902 /NCGR_PEP_ID=MMETSP0815-20121206/13266_1 /TAXON_ID=97485 /ORGANISM="Prymnesium parvum, Strain Texoma1" /LENGTH=66 /DNA_ID=CAMNT_0040757341 /DNA_START=238 /DNA_END=439 /DNA_ORIENTATION=+
MTLEAAKWSADKPLLFLASMSAFFFSSSITEPLLSCSDAKWSGASPNLSLAATSALFSSSSLTTPS